VPEQTLDKICIFCSSGNSFWSTSFNKILIKISFFGFFLQESQRKINVIAQLAKIKQMQLKSQNFNEIKYKTLQIISYIVKGIFIKNTLFNIIYLPRCRPPSPESPLEPPLERLTERLELLHGVPPLEGSCLLLLWLEQVWKDEEEES
jgi:hypothetical protein